MRFDSGLFGFLMIVGLWIVVIVGAFTAEPTYNCDDVYKDYPEKMVKMCWQNGNNSESFKKALKEQGFTWSDQVGRKKAQ